MKPKLNPGDVICYKCKGKGSSEHEPILSDMHNGYWKMQCDICHGEGKLDWIENIVGKEEKKVDGILVKPGVFTVEVDLSTYIPLHEPSLIVKGDKR